MARTHSKSTVFLPVQDVNEIATVYSTINQVDYRTSVSVVYSSLLSTGVESKHLDKHMSLISMICDKGEKTSCGNYYIHEIPRDYFRELVGSKNDVKEFKEEALATIGYLSETVSPKNGAVYFTGKDGKQGQCKTYKLDTSFVDATSLTFKVTYTQVEVKDLKTKNYVLTESNSRMVATIQNTVIDLKAALTDEVVAFTQHKNTHKFVQRMNSALSLVSRQRTISQSELTGRVTHTLSNVSKVARKHLSIYGQTFTEVDVRNCQPLLVAALIRDRGLSADIAFTQAVESGVLYDMFLGVSGTFYKFTASGAMTTIQQTLSEREDVKEEFFSAIMFDFKYHSPLNKKFKEVFPQTWESLKKLHSEDTTLAAQLQRMESGIFNSIIPTQGYYFTLYDAIFATDKDAVPGLVEDLEKKFNNYGLSVKIKVS